MPYYEISDEMKLRGIANTLSGFCSLFWPFMFYTLPVTVLEKLIFLSSFIRL